MYSSHIQGVLKRTLCSKFKKKKNVSFKDLTQTSLHCPPGAASALTLLQGWSSSCFFHRGLLPEGARNGRRRSAVCFYQGRERSAAPSSAEKTRPRISYSAWVFSALKRLPWFSRVQPRCINRHSR